MQKAVSFNDVAIIYVKGSGCRIHFWYMSKDDAISIMNNSNLIGKIFFYLCIKNACNTTYYHRDRDVILNRVKDFYENDKERLREQAKDKHKNLSEENLVSRFACNTRVIVDASSSPPVSLMSNSCNKTLNQINKQTNLNQYQIVIR